MKDKIDLIFSDLKNEVITEAQAHQRVLDLLVDVRERYLLIEWIQVHPVIDGAKSSCL